MESSSNSISTDEQALIRDSAARLVREASAKGLPEARDPPPELWRAMVELGWCALPFQEADSGLGGTVADICVLVCELGRGLQVGEFTLGTILLGRLVAAAPESALRSGLLETLIGGARTLALADREPGSRGGCSDLRSRAKPVGGGWLLDGAKIAVWAPASLRTLLVSALGSDDREMLLAVELGAPGLAVREFDTVDCGRALECAFTSVRVPDSAVVAAGQSDVRTAREEAWDCASVVTGSECVGIMHALVERTVDYLRSRKQFGKPLAQLQVLRHRMADMALAARRAEVLVERTAQEFAALDRLQRVRMSCAASVQALAGARWVAEQSVQLHGGVGVCAELPIGKYLRRVLALEATFGSAEYHRARFQRFRT